MQVYPVEGTLRRSFDGGVMSSSMEVRLGLGYGASGNVVV
jgi:hypothetical protein